MKKYATLKTSLTERQDTERESDLQFVKKNPHLFASKVNDAFTSYIKEKTGIYFSSDQKNIDGSYVKVLKSNLDIFTYGVGRINSSTINDVVTRLKQQIEKTEKQLKHSYQKIYRYVTEFDNHYYFRVKSVKVVKGDCVATCRASGTMFSETRIVTSFVEYMQQRQLNDTEITEIRDKFDDIKRGSSGFVGFKEHAYTLDLPEFGITFRRFKNNRIDITFHKGGRKAMSQVINLHNLAMKVFMRGIYEYLHPNGKLSRHEMND